MELIDKIIDFLHYNPPFAIKSSLCEPPLG